MTEQLSEHDIDVLMMHGGLKPIKPGAYFNAVSEWLMNHDYLTPMPWQLTDKGKAALQALKGEP